MIKYIDNLIAQHSVHYRSLKQLSIDVAVGLSLIAFLTGLLFGIIQLVS